MEKSDIGRIIDQVTLVQFKERRRKVRSISKHFILCHDLCHNLWYPSPYIMCASDIDHLAVGEQCYLVARFNNYAGGDICDSSDVCETSNTFDVFGTCCL